MKLRAGYEDGSGEEYILADGEAKLTLRWGCSCCKDTSPLTAEEIAFRDRIVKAVNMYDRMVRFLRKIDRYKGTVLNYTHYRSLKTILKDVER